MVSTRHSNNLLMEDLFQSKEAKNITDLQKNLTNCENTW